MWPPFFLFERPRVLKTAATLRREASPRLIMSRQLSMRRSVYESPPP